MPKGIYPHKSLEERIAENIIIDEITGCWLFQGYLDKDGYSNISHNGKTVRTHRATYILKNGLVEDGLVISHLCDIKYPKDSKEYRKCCNPEHLKAVTNKENLSHMVESGRSIIATRAFKKGQTAGEKNVKCKMLSKTVFEIRKRIMNGLKYGELKAMAEEYKITYVTIQAIAGRIGHRDEPEAKPEGWDEFVKKSKG